MEKLIQIEEVKLLSDEEKEKIEKEAKEVKARDREILDLCNARLHRKD